MSEETDGKIEHLARAIAAREGMPSEHFHAADHALRIGYYRRARAVIEAMRELTEAERQAVAD